MSVSVYMPLITYLATQEKNMVFLTFAEIEGLIGATLARSARVQYGYWTNPVRRHVADLQDAGWEAHLHAPAERVQFRRIEGTHQNK